MSLALKNSRFDLEEGDWLPLDEAAPLLGVSARQLRRLCATQWSAAGLAFLRAPREERGKRVWWLHRTADARLSRASVRQAETRSALSEQLSSYPEDYVTRAHRRAHWVDEWRKMVDAPRLAGITDRDLADQVVAEARRVEGVDFPVCVRSLQRWRHWLKTGRPGRGAGVEALIDRYAIGSAPGGATARSAQAVEYFYKHYRTRMQNSVQTCHRWTLDMARRNGCSWPASYSSTRAWLAENDDLSTTCACRDGRTVWCRRFMPYNEQDWEQVAPGQFYVADHTQCDFWVADGEKQFRPWLTAIQDCRSRRIVGWHFGPTPHQDSILTALRMAFHSAVPEVLRIDNGRDFKSRVITGLTKADCAALRAEFGRDWRVHRQRYNSLFACDDSRWLGLAGSLGIKLVYAQPYAAWSKGTIERFFRTFEDNVAKTFATYCGNAPSARPESLQLIREGYAGRPAPLPLPRGDKEGSKVCRVGIAHQDDSVIPTLDDARSTFAAWLATYDRSSHLGVGIDGRTPMEVWNSATSLRTVDHGALDLLIAIRGTYKVGPNGVSIQVGGKRWSYGARTPALRPWSGREVLVAQDPADPKRCIAFDPRTRVLIAALDPNDRIHPLTTNEDMRDYARQNARDRRVIRDSKKAEARRTLSSATELNRLVRRRRVPLAATGTDGRPPDAHMRPVRTGFEGVSIPDQIAGDAALGASAADAASRLSEFVKKDDDTPKSPTPWSRLARFARGGGDGT